MSDFEKNVHSIIPNPRSVTTKDGFFQLGPRTRISICAGLSPVGQYLQESIQQEAGYILDAAEGFSGDGAIALCIDDSLVGLEEDGYVLKATPNEIQLAAPNAAGVFYGVQTLLQLIQNGDGDTRVIPAVEIEDKPRFKWRGLMLDVGRHFYPITFIKRFIDLLAFHKMNVFHWHLTEDQGWRIEIQKYPKLTEIGSKRRESQTAVDRNRFDGQPHGGFYSQAEIKEVVDYAASRFVTVIPEIELPGHSLGALACYPELGCTGGPYEVETSWGIKQDVYCAGNENVYTFLEDVLSEVLELFPSRVIHIGGDEVPKDRWRACPKCQAMIASQELKDEDELQSYFIKRIEKFLNAKGRQLIGWDEILEGGLAPNAYVMSWRGIAGGTQAAAAGHDVVMSPTSHCYFDYYQSKGSAEPPGPYWEGAYLPLEVVYAYEPIPDELSPEQAKHILGAQGNIWTEFIASEEHVEYMTFPRATALAEVVWSSPEQRSYADFTRRLQGFLPRLQKRNVNYRDPFEHSNS